MDLDPAQSQSKISGPGLDPNEKLFYWITGSGEGVEEEQGEEEKKEVEEEEEHLLPPPWLLAGRPLPPPTLGAGSGHSRCRIHQSIQGSSVELRAV